MAKLTIRIPTTDEVFETTDIDFTQYNPQQIIDSMRGNLPQAGEGKGWKILRGGQVVDQHVALDQLGFRDGDTAELVAKVEGAQAARMDLASRHGLSPYQEVKTA